MRGERHLAMVLTGVDSCTGKAVAGTDLTAVLQKSTKIHQVAHRRAALPTKFSLCHSACPSCPPPSTSHHKPP